MEVIILAGGFGTRLQSVVKDLPKPMADINGKPFLEYILKYLSLYNISDLVLSVGYKKDSIEKHFRDKYENINIKYSSEDEPLGTGGAIKKAIEIVNKTDDKVLIINGDTFFKVDLFKFLEADKKSNSDVSICVKEMLNSDRYGSVKIKNNMVTKFEEKQFYKRAYINCGVYSIKKSLFEKIKTSNKFSFEKFLEDALSEIVVSPYISNSSYFIDIGIPNDYEKAKKDFKELF